MIYSQLPRKISVGLMSSSIGQSLIVQLEQYKEMRNEKKLSQEQVALAADMARPDISQFESGRYNPLLERRDVILCDFVNCWIFVGCHNL